MGMRPYFKLVIGIDDLVTQDMMITDPRWTLGEEWQHHKIVMPALDRDRDNKAMLDDLSVRSAVGVFANSSARLFSSSNKESSIDLWEILEFDPEYGPANVMGFTVAELEYANEVLYALACFYPKFDGKGYMVVPSVPPDLDESPASRKWRMRAQIDLEIDEEMAWKKRLWDEGHNYHWFLMEIDGWLAGAMWMFQQMEMPIERKDLKLMLYWKWS